MNELVNPFGLIYKYFEHMPLITGIDFKYSSVIMTDFFYIGLCNNIWHLNVEPEIYEYKIQSINIR